MDFDKFNQNQWHKFWYNENDKIFLDTEIGHRLSAEETESVDYSSFLYGDCN